MVHEMNRVHFNGIRVMAGWPERVKAAQEITHYEIGGKSYRRVLFGDEPGPSHGDNRFACHDCAVVRGQFHVPGCDVEACPICGGQSIGCYCHGDEEAEENSGAFSFETHKRKAIAAYLIKRSDYEEFCDVVKNIIEQAIFRQGIKVNTVQARTKDKSSFESKATKPSDTNPAEPKYPNPLEDITDLAGIRVIAFSPNDIAEIGNVISQEFKVLERSNKGEKLIAEERFGYNSVHYLIKLSSNRALLPEYEKFENLVAEIQVRTILQHAWAEIEHDIQYKSTSVIPIDIRRRFMALAGMLELADREFQAVQHEDKRLRQEARKKIREGEIDEVEITPDALKAFLTERFGVDKRISWLTYDYLARMLRKCGFANLRQVEVCTEGYDGDALSQLVYGFRQGQSVRFQLVILAGMGKSFMQRHPLADDEWFRSHGAEILERYRQNKIQVRKFDPSKYAQN